jgi:threonine/homoserine/homoserine lactone efflux protein
MPPFNPNIIIAIIKALAQFVPVLDKHRFGAIMLILVIVAAGALMAVPYLPTLLA